MLRRLAARLSTEPGVCLAVTVVLVACVFGLAASAPAGLVPAAAARPAEDLPAATSSVGPPFRTLPPGSTLPDDETCARAVARSPETIPANAPANATAGDRPLPADFFPPGSGNAHGQALVASRVDGAYTGTTPQLLSWVACKWGIDERYVRAQAQAESSLRQGTLGDWTTDPSHCAPEHGLGVDGRPGQCPESFGILQVRYRYFRGAFPQAITSTAYNLDTAYAVWRACYEGYESWLGDTAPPGTQPYGPGHAWACIGRWYSGAWMDPDAEHYVMCVSQLLHGREPCS